MWEYTDEDGDTACLWESLAARGWLLRAESNQTAVPASVRLPEDARRSLAAALLESVGESSYKCETAMRNLREMAAKVEEAEAALAKAADLLHCPDHVELLEWAEAVGAHVSRIRRREAGGICLGGYDTAERIADLRQPPKPVPTEAGLWFLADGGVAVVARDGDDGDLFVRDVADSPAWQKVLKANDDIGAFDWLPDPDDPSKAQRCEPRGGSR